MNGEFHQWLTARPMETAVDLSRPGEITVPFQQTCSISHGEAFYFKCDLDGASMEKPEQLFQDLSAKITIKDADGNEIENAKINSATVHNWDDDIILAEIAPFQTGKYVATIRIESGVPALANKQQTVYAKYQFCGVEQVPAVVVGAVAFGAGLIGVVSALCVLPGLLRYGIWRSSPLKSSSLET